MTNIVFFGHDAYDAALRRRIRALVDSGATLSAFTMRRGPEFAAPWRNIDLGRTRDAAFGQRLAAMAQALPALAAHRDLLRDADLFFARNLDMLAIAVAAQKISGSRAKIVYECLDVHRLMTRPDLIGAAMRAAEGALLGQSNLLVVSSPAFVERYFQVRHPGRFRAFLAENRLPPGFAYGERPSASRMREERAPLTIGWFGVLRCRRSLDLLLALARADDRVRILMRGYPSLSDIPDFDHRVQGLPNVEFGGRYAWPDDLSRIYDSVDLVWAGDFHDADANSRWLLPNRLYEGGYYAAPPVAPADSETGRWIAARGFGFTLAEPIEHTLPELIRGLREQAIEAARNSLIAAPTETFLQPKAEIEALLEAALETPGR